MADLRTPGESLQLVGAKVNLLVTKVKELRELGLNELNKEIPELVLVGDQSAGKSTLMSAITEIHLPKGDSMCTRCPANITTSPAGTWSCTVSLLHYYDYSRDSSRNPTKNHPFPPWKEKPDGGMEKVHFKTISNKKELEMVLRWAQVALLNPR
jgi:GTPase SAR1 family protein